MYLKTDKKNKKLKLFHLQYLSFSKFFDIKDNFEVYMKHCSLFVAQHARIIQISIGLISKFNLDNKK